MTLAPIANRHVVGCVATKYELNKVCAHPECAEPAVDAHHCFRRSQIGNDSWFVSIDQAEPIPHVVGLCRTHHAQVTINEAWIKLEGDWIWYDRDYLTPSNFGIGAVESADTVWTLAGPLTPQPGQIEGKPKRKRKQGEERRKRRTISIRVPADNEDGGAIWDETLDRVKERLVEAGLYDENSLIPDYEAAVAAWNDWLNS